MLGGASEDVRQVGGVHCRVVSCTPPWRFEECSTAPATDNRTVDHTSDKLPQRYTAITARYIALGENGSELGASVYGEIAVAGGTAQRYQRVQAMVDTMEEFFGSCTNHGECQEACPKEISIDFIAYMNRDYVKAQLKNRKLLGQT